MTATAAPRDRIGGYRLADLIGEGGGARVYRAVHEATGRVVALKAVPVDDPHRVDGLRREIQGLARLRHPGIARILDEGERDGAPWYAMELIDGVTLRRRIEPGARDTWPTLPARPGRAAPAPACGGPVPPAEIAGILHGLCDALAYLHGEGFVHRDLKPENVVLRPDGRPVLVDFGLVAAFAGREVLATDALTAGTAAYMAPEQALGELVDARADLYALGCIAFELATGRPPFAGSTAREVIDAHLHRPPPRLAEVAPDAPAWLDGLIARLLAKRPRERAGHADEIAAALAAHAGRGPQPARAPARPYLYRPGFEGRRAELNALERLVDRADDGEGGIALIGGDSGVGKTRLVVELARRYRHRGGLVCEAACAAEGAQPLEPLRPALRALARWCAERGAVETDRVLGARGRVLAAYEPRLATLPGQADYPPEAELPADAARRRLFAYVTESLAAWSQAQPCLIVLDDLQWADELTCELLGAMHASGELQLSPLLVVATYRADDVRRPLRALLDLPGLTTIDVGPLDDAAVERMVSGMMGVERAPAPLARTLCERVDGNPFFVAEYLRAAVAEGLLVRDAGGRWTVGTRGERALALDDLPLPATVEELVAHRLAGLSSRAVTIAELAAAQGRAFDAALLADTAPLGADDVRAALSELLTQHVVEETAPAHYRFAHDTIRRVTYARIAAGRRAAAHRAIAAAMEARLGERAGEHAGELGRHWELGGEPSRAAARYLAAGRHALSRYALADAERWYRAYLRLAAADARETAEARVELGVDILRPRGDVAGAERELHAALDAAERGGHAAIAVRALRGLAEVYLRMARLDDADAECRRALAAARAQGDRRAEGRVLVTVLETCWQRGRLDEACAVAEEALVLLRELGDDRAVGAALGRLGVARWQQGDLRAADDLYARAIELHQRTGDRAAEAETWSRVGALRFDQGRLDEADAAFERSLQLLRDCGDVRTEAIVLANSGTLSWHEGRLDDAERRLERALAIMRRIGDTRVEGVIASNLATVRRDRGHVDEARAMYARAIERLDACGDRLYLPDALRRVAELERLTGADFDAAAEHIERALAIHRELGNSLGVALALCERAHLALATGADPTAMVDEARAIARDTGVGADSELGVALARLERAIDAPARGIERYRGDDPALVPDGVRRWLRFA